MRTASAINISVRDDVMEFKNRHVVEILRLWTTWRFDGLMDLTQVRPW